MDLTSLPDCRRIGAFGESATVLQVRSSINLTWCRGFRLISFPRSFVLMLLLPAFCRPALCEGLTNGHACRPVLCHGRLGPSAIVHLSDWSEIRSFRPIQTDRSLRQVAYLILSTGSCPSSVQLLWDQPFQTSISQTAEQTLYSRSQTLSRLLIGHSQTRLIASEGAFHRPCHSGGSCSERWIH